MGWVKAEAEHLMQDRKIGEMSGIPRVRRKSSAWKATWAASAPAVTFHGRW
jgi:hypothetical protein